MLPPRLWQSLLSPLRCLAELLSGGASRAWPHHRRHHQLSRHEAERPLAVPGPEIYEWRKFQSADPFFLAGWLVKILGGAGRGCGCSGAPSTPTLSPEPFQPMDLICVRPLAAHREMQPLATTSVAKTHLLWMEGIFWEEEPSEPLLTIRYGIHRVSYFWQAGKISR